MAAMQCDICGKTLTMDVTGSFGVCDYCGMKHPKERLMRIIAGTASSNVSEDVVTSSATSYVEEVKESVDNGFNTMQTFGSMDIGFDELVESEIEQEKAEQVNSVENTYKQASGILSSFSSLDMKGSSSDSIEDNASDDVEPVTEETVEEPTEQMNESLYSESIGTFDKVEEPVIEPAEPVVQSEEQQEDRGPVINNSLEQVEKNRRIEKISGLKAELREFEEIYEANKNKFLGEGLKKKNYAETKIQEIKEKLADLEESGDEDIKAIAEPLNTSVGANASVSEEGLVNSTVTDVDLESMNPVEREEYGKQQSKIKELKAELVDFENIYEENKNQFFGEGLKKKNYSNIKIKEIKEKLVELGELEYSVDVGGSSSEDLINGVKDALAQVDVEALTQVEKEEHEKKLSKVEEFATELREFEVIYEENKNQIFGEGYKKKNYADMKIKELKEKLLEMQN